MSGKVVSIFEFRLKRPPLISMAELADILNERTGTDWWTAERCRRHLPREALKQLKGGGRKRVRWYTTMELIRRAMPDQWEEMQRRLAVIEDDDE